MTRVAKATFIANHNALIERLMPLLAIQGGCPAPRMIKLGGVPQSTLYRTLDREVQLGEIFVEGTSRNDRRFFKDEEEAKRCRQGVQKPTFKGRKVEEPKPVQIGFKHIARAPRITEAWKNAEANTAGIKVTKCPSGRDTRFDVPADFIGEFALLKPGRYIDVLGESS